jgi:CheY-like chemotaxis protein
MLNVTRRKKGAVVDKDGEKPKKILVVDDIGAVRKRYASILRTEGYEVSVAVDGKEALEFCGRRFFDLILLDLNMPGMNGLDVLYELRSNYSKIREVFNIADVPVLCISGYGSEEAVSTAHLLGAAGVLSKPVNLEELLSRVKALLEGGYDAAAQQRRVVVIVDPSPHNRGLFRHIFEGMGWRVADEPEPERLVSVLNGSTTPYVIVASLPAGRIDEEALLVRLAAIADRVPVLAIAQNPAQEARVVERLNGRAVVLVRPVVLDKLTEAIERAERLLDHGGQKVKNGPAGVSYVWA